MTKPEDDPAFIMSETLVYQTIDELRAENESLHRQLALNIETTSRQLDERDALRAENERLERLAEEKATLIASLVDEVMRRAAEQGRRLAEIERLVNLLAGAGQMTQEAQAENERLHVQVMETARECGIQKTDNERLRLADRQWADHVKRLSEEVERLRAAG